MNLRHEENIDIFQKTAEMTGRISEIDKAIVAENIERYTSDPATIEALRLQLSKMRACEEEIKWLKWRAERNLTSRNVLTVDVPEGYRINLARLCRWAELINPNVMDDPYAKKLYLVCLCDLKFLDRKRKEFEAKLSELEQGLVPEKNADITRLEEQRDEHLTKLGDYVSSVTNEPVNEETSAEEIHSVNEETSAEEIHSVNEVNSEENETDQTTADSDSYDESIDINSSSDGYREWVGVPNGNGFEQIFSEEEDTAEDDGWDFPEKSEVDDTAKAEDDIFGLVEAESDKAGIDETVSDETEGKDGVVVD